MDVILPLFKKDYRNDFIIIDSKRKLYFKKENIDIDYDYYTIINIDDDKIIKEKNRTPHFFLSYKKKINLKNIDIKLKSNLEYRYIEGFSKYLALEDGTILNLKTGNSTKGSTAGHYLKVNLIRDGNIDGEMLYVHRLICISFHGKSKGKNMVVMHKDNNKLNNHKNNLKWGSQSSNIKDSYKARVSKEDNTKFGEERMENINILKELAYTDKLKLSTRVDMISTEENVFIKTFNYITDSLRFIPNMFAKINRKILDIQFNYKMDQVRDLKKFNKQAKKFNDKIDFIKVENRMVPVLLGLDADYQTVSNFLKENGEFNKGLVPLLKRTNVMLAKTISDPSYNKTFSDVGKLLKDEEKKLTNVKKEFGTIIDAEKVHDKMKVGDVIKSLNQTVNISDTMIKALPDYDMKYLKNSQKLVTNITEKVDVIIEMMENKEIEFTKESLNGLIKYIEVAGDSLTLSTQLYYMFVQQINMLVGLEKVISKEI